MVTMIMLILEAAIQPTSKKHPNFKRLLDVGETTVRHTDSEGKAFFDNLDQGTYQITEIKTEPGNALLKEPIIFTLPFTMTMEEAAQHLLLQSQNLHSDIKSYLYGCKPAFILSVLTSLNTSCAFCSGVAWSTSSSGSGVSVGSGVIVGLTSSLSFT